MTDQEQVEITSAVNSRRIFELPRNILEQFTAALSTSDAFSHFSAPEFPAVCETVRMALAMKVSADENSQARRLSLIALGISVFALIAGLVQVGLAVWQICQPMN